jgi:cell volume regulation protein A
VLGTALTAAAAGLAILVLVRLPIADALLVGAVLASTDSAAVFGVLRRTGLRRRLVLTLEAESGLNDPVAILLVISIVGWVQQPGGDPVTIGVFFAQGIVLGLVFGVVTGLVGAYAFKSRWLPSDALYAVGSFALAAVAFGAAQTLGGSGFLAVYIAGLILGNEARHGQRFITNFLQGVASLADIALFVVFGLLVMPGDLATVAAEGVAVALILAFVARPLAVVLVTSRKGFSVGEKALLSWAGLRGAVPVLLATIPVTEGLPNSLTLFNVTFVAVLASAVMQGTTVGPLARTLGLTRSREAPGTDPGLVEAVYVVSPLSEVAGRRAGNVQLPEGASLARVARSGTVLAPSDSTRIRADDTLHIVVEEDAQGDLEAIVSSWDEKPWEIPAWADVPQRSLGREAVKRELPAALSRLQGFARNELAHWRQLLSSLRLRRS